MKSFLRLVGRHVARSDRLRGTIARHAEAASAALGSTRDERYGAIFDRFAEFTRIPRAAYVANLRLIDRFRSVEGCVVECGTWRGGMIAGIASLLGARRSYHLFDSFQGLPDAAPIDGERALAWQAGNVIQGCRTEERFVHDAMRRAGAARYAVHAGWFAETLPPRLEQPIAILRLDADWYSSTAECLNHMYDQVAVGGLLILDDYYTWDGCSRAVHDFLSSNVSADRIREEPPQVAYLVKAAAEPCKPIDPRRSSDPQE